MTTLWLREALTLMRRLIGATALAACAATSGCASSGAEQNGTATPFLTVLGIAQDGGVPQAGAFSEPGWRDPAHRRMVACLGLVDPASGQMWMFDATPDFPEQLEKLHRSAEARTQHGESPRESAPTAAAPATATSLSGIFLTHAHIGHYTGLMYLGHEAMGAKGVPVYAMPRMKSFLETNGPWSQLVKYGNISLRELEAGTPGS